MLREIKTIGRGPERRWFSDDELDLILWFSDESAVVALQLCYGKPHRERAVSWSPQGGYGHFRVDTGEGDPARNRTPILVSDGPFPREQLIAEFSRAAVRIDPAIRSFVVARLQECPDETRLRHERRPDRLTGAAGECTRVVPEVLARSRAGGGLRAFLGEYGGQLACTVALWAIVLGGGWLVARHFSGLAGMGRERPRPATLERAEVMHGTGLLTRRPITTDLDIGPVTSIASRGAAPGRAGLVVAGPGGAAIFDEHGTVTRRVFFSTCTAHVDVLRASDGTLRYVNRGSRRCPASLIGQDGYLLWSHGERARPPAAGDMAAGQIDGESAFIVGFIGGDGLRRLDEQGHVRWQQPESAVPHIELADVDGDGRVAIVHSNGRGQLTVRGPNGALRSRAAVAGSLSTFSLIRWPERSAPRVAHAVDGGIRLLNLDGTVAAELTAPRAAQVGHARAVTARLRVGEPQLLVVLVDYPGWSRGALYLYRPDGALSYAEILGERAPALAVVPGADGADVLLVGGAGRLWRYETAPRPGG